MASSIEVEPMDLMAEHLAALRSNVRKVFFQHETLSPEEELDRAAAWNSSWPWAGPLTWRRER